MIIAPVSHIDLARALFISSDPTCETQALPLASTTLSQPKPFPIYRRTIDYPSRDIAEDTAPPATPHVIDMRFSTTTFLCQSGEAGPGRQYLYQRIGMDTTLIGNSANASIYKRLLPTLEAELGVFANMPFGA